MLNQNPNRYSKVAGGYQIQAGPNVKPLIFPEGGVIEVLPLLEADGIIIKVGDVHIASPKTLKALDEARKIDPHYWYVENGRITLPSGESTSIGKTVQILEVDITRLQGMASEQEFGLRTAGVLSVDWPYDDEGPVPEGILRQINWTLSQTAQRPKDRFTRAGLALEADYSYETLRIAKPEPGGRINPDGIKEIIRRVSARVADLQKDFNVIQGVFFDGRIPADARALPQEELEATNSTEPAKPEDRANRQRVQKETRLVGVDTGPTDRKNGDVTGPDTVSSTNTVTPSTGDTVLPSGNSSTDETVVESDKRRGVVGTAVDIATKAASIVSKLSPIAWLAKKLFGRK